MTMLIYPAASAAHGTQPGPRQTGPRTGFFRVSIRNRYEPNCRSRE